MMCKLKSTGAPQVRGSWARSSISTKRTNAHKSYKKDNFLQSSIKDQTQLKKPSWNLYGKESPCIFIQNRVIPKTNHTQNGFLPIQTTREKNKEQGSTSRAACAKNFRKWAKTFTQVTNMALERKKIYKHNNPVTVWALSSKLEN